MIGVYKITSPSGKIYIGQSINLKKREDNYRKLRCDKQPKLYNSLQKYSWEQHKFEIIEECSIEQLNEKEIYWKQYYLEQMNNDWEKILFCELYDRGGGPRSEETKQKISKKLLNSYTSGERKAYWKNKSRPKHSEYMKENSGFRYERTPEHEIVKSQAVKKAFLERGKEIGEKISNSKKGKGTKQVQCIETNEIFNSIIECSKKTGISAGCICNFLKGTYKYSSLRGLTFRYFKKDLAPQS